MTYYKCTVTLDTVEKHAIFYTFIEDDNNDAVIAIQNKRNFYHEVIELQIDDTKRGAADILNFIRANTGIATRISKNDSVHFDVPEDQFAASQRKTQDELERYNLAEDIENKVDALLDGHIFENTKPDSLHDKIALLNQLDAKKWHYTKYLRAAGFEEADGDILGVEDLSEQEVNTKVIEYENNQVVRH